jgi:hypothetical protein
MKIYCDVRLEIDKLYDRLNQLQDKFANFGKIFGRIHNPYEATEEGSFLFVILIMDSWIHELYNTEDSWASLTDQCNLQMEAVNFKIHAQEILYQLKEDGGVRAEREVSFMPTQIQATEVQEPPPIEIPHFRQSSSPILTKPIQELEACFPISLQSPSKEQSHKYQIPSFRKGNPSDAPTPCPEDPRITVSQLENEPLPSKSHEVQLADEPLHTPEEGDLLQQLEAKCRLFEVRLAEKYEALQRENEAFFVKELAEQKKQCEELQAMLSDIICVTSEAPGVVQPSLPPTLSEPVKM